ncbi:hypothetical protein GYH30_030498 [Glycine max]|uniref:Uncharacterized protein n=1 Tax=Glycine max TaxID=3847 RepID=A0A0R0HNL7_SOYBN|nr:hypothetical protein GYH30_030498 [Glycine max]
MRLVRVVTAYTKRIPHSAILRTMVFIFHEKKKKNCPRKRPIILHVWVIGVEKKSSLEGNFKELLLKEE